MSGTPTWPATAWRTLLELTLPALEEVRPRLAWTLGGGTALALALDHRTSYDIGIFFEDAGALRALSPDRNEATRGITDRWQQPGRHIKLERDEGEIHLVAAGPLTELAPWALPFQDRDVPVEQPAEVLAKKLAFQSSRLAPRDVFDLIAIHHHDATMIEVALAAVPDAARHATDRITRIADRYRATIRDEVNPTAAGAELLAIDPLEAARILGGR